MNILGVVRQGKRGVGGGGQYLAVVYIHDHAGRALHLLTFQVLQGGGQNILHRLLQHDVNGEHDVAARLRLGLPGLVDHLAAVVAFHDAGAGLAPQLAFKGALHALFAHLVVHGVAALLLVVLPLGGAHGGHPAQQMGGVLGGVHPHGGRLHHHPGQGVFFHLGDKVDVHVLRKHIRLPVHVPFPQIQLIQHARQQPGLVGVLLPPVLQPEALAQGGQDFRGGGAVLFGVQLFGAPGRGGLVLVGVVGVVHILRVGEAFQLDGQLG